MSTNFNLITDENGEGKVTFVSNGVLVTIPSDHPNFARISHALVEGNDPTDFIDVFKAATDLSDRVTVTDDQVFYDGEEIAGGVATTILRYRSEGRDSANLVAFLERVQKNPSRRSREQLWGWVSNRDLHIDHEGRIVAWKGVLKRESYASVEVGPVPEHSDYEKAQEPETVVTYTSHARGTAWVNGHKHEGQIPYAVGDEVIIPRELVMDDPDVPCSHGLHIGTFEYAKGYAGRGNAMLEVAVAPEDVVSVPKDSGQQKIRCAKFEVLAVQDVPTPDLSHWEPEAERDSDEDEAAAEEALSRLVDEETESRIDVEDGVYTPSAPPFEVDKRSFIGRLFGKRKGDES